MKINTELTERVVMAKKFKEGDRVKYSDTFLDICCGYRDSDEKRRGTFICMEDEKHGRVHWDDTKHTLIISQFYTDQLLQKGSLVLIDRICHAKGD